MKRFLLLAVMALTAAAETPEEAERSIRSVLATTKVSLDLNMATLPAALTELEVQTGLTFVLSPIVRKLVKDQEKALVEIRLKDVPAGTTLRLMLANISMKYEVTAAGVYIRSDDEPGEMVTSAIDIRGLFTRRDDLPGPDISLHEEDSSVWT